MDEEATIRKEQRAYALKMAERTLTENWINENVPEDQRLPALAALRGIQLGGKAKGGDDNTVKNLQAAQKRIVEYKNSLLKPYEDGMEEIPNEVQAQVDELEHRWFEIDNVIRGLTGVDPQINVAPLTGDPEKDAKSIETVWAMSGKNYSSFRDAMEKLFEMSNLSDQQRDKLRKLIKKQYYSGHNRYN